MTRSSRLPRSHRNATNITSLAYVSCSSRGGEDTSSDDCIDGLGLRVSWPSGTGGVGFGVMISPEIASGDGVGCGKVGGGSELFPDRQLQERRWGAAVSKGPFYKQLQKARLYTVHVIFLIVVAARVPLFALVLLTDVLLFPLVLLPTPFILTLFR